MKLVSVANVLTAITAVYDGDRAPSLAGNFLGLYGISPSALSRGHYEWYAINGDHGECDSAEEAQREIQEAWSR